MVWNAASRDGNDSVSELKVALALVEHADTISIVGKHDHALVDGVVRHPGWGDRFGHDFGHGGGGLDEGADGWTCGICKKTISGMV